MRGRSNATSRLRLPALLAAVLLGVPSHAGHAAPHRIPHLSLRQEPTKVWVNTRSSVYHCPGTRYYRNTVSGEYLTEPEARRRGNRPAGGRTCGPLRTNDSAGPSPATPRSLISSGTGLLPDVGPTKPSDALSTCELVRIMDGDTIECRGLGSVRLIGVDSPEGDQEPFGTAASAGLASLAPVGTTLLLEQDVEARDRYNRLLAYAWTGESMLNWLLLRHGWAVSLKFPPNTRYADRFDAAEHAASREGRGLWSVNGFRCRPADKRRAAC
jgi:micrococcal nuclease